MKIAKTIDPKSKDNNRTRIRVFIKYRMKFENGAIALNKLVKDFIKKAESIEAKEEKVLNYLITLAKRLQDKVN